MVFANMEVDIFVLYFTIRGRHKWVLKEVIKSKKTNIL